ncbi:hypothetical protein GALMADRAFT_146617 [Galerina marginata CBS 339.88]|uniref:Uncharacterized protein n=1 Tax=Galerina marginata (strain CBS 339.88) TaxID=685588 RepID=A0A067SDQ4_GALM3|nr:hypothetical protein GALMADRAFT_146617 [Galerina marginata CBS 339.88]
MVAGNTLLSLNPSPHFKLRLRVLAASHPPGLRHIFYPCPRIRITDTPSTILQAGGLGVSQYYPPPLLHFFRTVLPPAHLPSPPLPPTHAASPVPKPGLKSNIYGSAEVKRLLGFNRRYWQWRVPNRCWRRNQDSQVHNDDMETKEEDVLRKMSLISEHHSPPISTLADPRPREYVTPYRPRHHLPNLRLTPGALN